jgi:hypothetical protein
MLIFLDPSPKYSGDLPVFSLIPDLKHDHYLMECPLYQTERYCLFRNLLFGNDEINMNKNYIIFQ